MGQLLQNSEYGWLSGKNRRMDEKADTHGILEEVEKMQDKVQESDEVGHKARRCNKDRSKQKGILENIKEPSRTCST